MKNGLFLFALLLMMTQAFAQGFVVSSPQKVTGKTPYIDVLGNSPEGILIHKHGRKINWIEAYDFDLRMTWRKALNFRYEEIRMRDLTIHNDRVVMVYVGEGKTGRHLVVQAADFRFSKFSKEIILDSSLIDKGVIWRNVKVSVAANKATFVITYPQFSGDRLTAVNYLILNRDLDLISRGRVTTPDHHTVTVLAQQTLSSDSNLVLVFYDQEGKRKDDRRTKNYSIYTTYWPTDATVSEHKVFKNFLFGAVKVGIDEVNHKLVMAAMYAENERGGAHGLMCLKLDLRTGKTEQESWFPFSRDLVFSLTGKDQARSGNELFSFEVDRLVVRYNGSLLIVAESQYNDAQSYEMPNFSPAITPSFRTVNVFYYNDLIVFSVNAKGELEKQDVMRKKQISEDDDGFYSSYSMVTTPSSLHFVYNEEIFPKTNFAEYLFSHTGSIKRNTLFNAAEQNLMLVPRLARQISSSEVVIPSFRKNYFSLVKIKFYE